MIKVLKLENQKLDEIFKKLKTANAKDLEPKSEKSRVLKWPSFPLLTPQLKSSQVSHLTCIWMSGASGLGNQTIEN